MVTIDREIKSKNERFGSFEIRTKERNSDAQFDNANRSFGSIRNLNDTKEQEEQRLGTVITPAAKRLNVSDNFTDLVRNNKSKAGVAPKEQVKALNILMVVGYVLVLAALVTLVVLNANQISLLQAKNNELETSIVEMNNTISSMSVELQTLSEETRIQNLAASALSLGNANVSTINMSVPAINKEVEVVKQTNWFDEIYNKINSIIE